MRQCLVFVILCMFAALSCSPLMAQSGSIQVQPQFFGITTTTYDQSVSPFQALGIYWPSTSFPGVSIGAEGKGGSYTSWWSLETYPLTLKTNSMFPNGYWQGSFVTIPNGSASSWVALDFMVNAAQNNTPPIDVMYTYWQTPQWAVCYDYGSGYGGDRWGGPTTQNPNAQDCSNAPIRLQLPHSTNVHAQQPVNTNVFAVVDCMALIPHTFPHGNFKFLHSSHSGVTCRTQPDAVGSVLFDPGDTAPGWRPQTQLGRPRRDGLV